MNPEDLIDIDELADKTATALLQKLDVNQQINILSAKIASNSDSAFKRIAEELNTNVDQKFKSLQEPVSQAVTAQFAIGAGIGGVLLLILMYTIWQCRHGREITNVFKNHKEKLSKLEEVVHSQRDMASSIGSIPGTPRHISNMV